MIKRIISLRYFYQCFVNYLPLILLITLSITAVSGIVSFFLTHKYRAETELLVNMKEISYGDTEANLNAIQTFGSIIKSAYIMEPVIQKLQLNESASELAKNVYIRSANNASQVFSIVVEDPNQKRAAMIANTISQVFQNKIKSIFNIQNVHILTKAKTDSKPQREPSIYLYLSIGLTLGLIISMMTVLWFEIRKPHNRFKKTNKKEGKDSVEEIFFN